MPIEPLSVQEIFNQKAMPFEEMLSRPYQPQPIDTMQQKFTGYEPTGVGIGKMALAFTQGMRQRRIADFLEQERNTQNAINRYEVDVRAALQDPDLSPAGRAAIEQEGNKTLWAANQFELQQGDKKNGIVGLLSGIAERFTGGPTKIRTFGPQEFEAATGRIHNLRQQHSQAAIYKDSYGKAMQILKGMEDTSKPVVTQEAGMQALREIRSDLAERAPTQLQKFDAVLLDYLPKRGSDVELIENAQRRRQQQQAAQQNMPQSAPPPARLDQFGREVAPGGSAVYRPVPEARAGEITSEPPRQDEFGRSVLPYLSGAPAASTAPAGVAPGAQVRLADGRVVTVKSVNADGTWEY